jgi:hypothetical protein
MTRFVLIPTNEGQSMNCSVQYMGTPEGAATRAQQIAAGLQSVLDGATINCEVRQQGVDGSNEFLVVDPLGVTTKAKR